MPNTADLMDKDEGELQCCDLQLRNLGKRKSFSGFIRTVRCREDNELVGKVLREPGEGHVLVVDGGGSLRTALLGDRLATRGSIHGWAGIIVNGAVRDVAALADIDFGVKALGSSPRRSGKKGYGKVDETVTFGNVTFTPGHWLCSDDDGIVVAPPPPETKPKVAKSTGDATTKEYEVASRESEVEQPVATAEARAEAAAATTSSKTKATTEPDQAAQPSPEGDQDKPKTTTSSSRRRKRVRLGDRLRNR